MLNGIQVRFEMAEKQVYKQTERHTDIFVMIIEEFIEIVPG